MASAPEHLARAIAALFAAGLPQDAATVHCLASTLGPLPPAVLAARLAADDDLEAGPLRELLFSPGREAVLALEPALAAAGLDPAGQADLERDLAGTIRLARVLLPGMPLELTVTGEDVRVFVARLYPARTPPQALRDLMAGRFPAQTALELAVAGRQAALDWSAPRCSFLAALLSRLDPTAPDPLEVVRYALGLLAILPADTPPLAALPRRRAALASQLRRAQIQEQSLAGSNFETLILTGARLPHLHAPDIVRDLALLDTITTAVTGRPAMALSPIEQDLGEVADAQALLAALGHREA